MRRLVLAMVLIGAATIGVAAQPAVAEHAEVVDGPPRELASRLANGHGNACVVLDNGALRCWGAAVGVGVPGASDEFGSVIGDDETADSVRPVDLGGERVVEVDGGDSFTCALLASGDVRCWGSTVAGKLGQPDMMGGSPGTGEEPLAYDPVDLGGPATAIAAGNSHVCALLVTGQIRCWGEADRGQLGYGNEENIGDDPGEDPSSVAVVPLPTGRTATALTAGRDHTCAILDGGDVLCWGDRDAIPGQIEDIGDDEPASAGPITNLGGERAVSISAGYASVCAVTDAGNVWCWGAFAGGIEYLGLTGRLVDPTLIDLGGLSVRQVSLGFEHACAVTVPGEIYCWGLGAQGRLGYGDEENIGDDEPFLSAGPVDVGAGRTVLVASAGWRSTCVLLDDLTVRCWGNNVEIGLGIDENAGDDERPAEVPAVNYQGTASFVPLSPARILDTRPQSDEGAANRKGIVAPGGSIDVQVTGLGGVPADDVYAVVMNVTIANSTGAGFVTAHPTGTSRPTASNINVEASQNAPNLVVVPVGDGGQVTLYTSGGGHLIGDVFGYFEQTATATAGRLVGVSPSRIFDTRPSNDSPGPKGKLGGGDTLEVSVTGTNGVPETGVSAVVLNLTAANATAAGYVTAWPGDEPMPATSNLNLSFANESRPNAVIVPVSETGTIKLFTERGAHLLADVTGYFTDETAPDTDDGLFVPLSPARLLDTRADGVPVPPGGVASFEVTERLGIPTTANATVLNLTIVQSLDRGFVTGWPSDESRPTASVLNARGPGQNIANLAILPLALPSGDINLYTDAGAHLLADTSGYFL